MNLNTFASEPLTIETFFNNNYEKMVSSPFSQSQPQNLNQPGNTSDFINNNKNTPDQDNKIAQQQLQDAQSKLNDAEIAKALAEQQLAQENYEKAQKEVELEAQRRKAEEEAQKAKAIKEAEEAKKAKERKEAEERRKGFAK